MNLGRIFSAFAFVIALCSAAGSLYAQSPAPAGAASPSLPTEHDPWPSESVVWGSTADHGAHPRHVGRGHPLEGTSWLNRPLSSGWFVGGLVGDDLIDGRITMHSDFMTGLRLGWDLDYFWGTEIRLGWSEVEVSDALQPPGPAPADVFLADVNYLRYIWGDSQVRPYWSIGLGLSTFHFIDSTGVDYNESLVTIPLGVGIKYLHRPWMAVRVELQDNITLAGGGLDSMQNFTFTIAAEMRLGGRPRSYWPWHPSREIW